MIPDGPYTLHLLRSDEGRDGLSAAVGADRDAGVEIWLVLLHDLGDPWFRIGEAYGDVIVRLADDCRRRGHPVPEESLEYSELVELMAGAVRVTSW